jgi:hypothetical protein
MARLNIERQKELELKRLSYAKKKLMELGFDVTESETELRFFYKGSIIKFFPYSGWHSGKGIKDGRGLNKLLKQIGENNDKNSKDK